MTRSSDARAKSTVTYEIIAESNGHKWFDWRGMICCRDCGYMRRPADDNNPCKGKVYIALRSPSVSRPPSGGAT